MRTVLFINANSRRARPLIAQAKSDLAASDSPFELIDTIVVRRLGHMDQALDRLKAAEDLQCVVIGSGDGTIITVINALQGRKNVVFGFLPLGTGNAFVRSLGIPVAYSEAQNVLRQQRIHAITLGEANGILIANMAALGLSARMAGQISDSAKKYFGQAAFALTTLKLLISHKAFHCQFSYDGKKAAFYSHQLVIANGKYHGPRPISTEASVLKDHLVLVAFGANQSRTQYLSSTIRFLLRLHESHAATRIIPFKHGVLTTQPVRAVETDGEVTTKTPLTLTIKPAAIRAIVGDIEHVI